MAIEKERSVRSGTQWALSASAALIAVLVFIVSIYLGPLKQAEGIEIGYVLAIMLSFELLVLFVTSRLFFSLMFTGLLFLTISAVAYLKQLYLGNALLISDVYYMTGTSVIKTVVEYPKLWKLVVGYLLLVAILLFATWRYAWRPFADTPKLSRFIVRLPACLMAAALMAWCLMPAGPFAALYAKTMWVAINENAWLTSFFMSIDVMKVVLPRVHNTPAENAAWESLATSSARIGGTMRPDIVLVLEESTFDPSTLPECDIQQCLNHSLILSDSYTKSHGPLRSYVYGGGTWLSEFAVLTGLPHPVFGLAGGYAPWLVAPRIRDSLPRQLHRLGYRNIALYPVEGGYMNARDAYSHYGFDALYDAEELGIQAWSSSDDTMFKVAQQVYSEESKKFAQPLFMIVKTVRQHGPHDNHPLNTLPSPYNKGLFPHLSADAQLDLSNYLARLDMSDQSMEELEKFFLQRDRPTIVVSFGDHKPSFSGVMDKFKITPPAGFDGDAKYITYFKLDTNFDTPPLPTYPVLDIAYLPGLILQAGNLPSDRYFAATEHLRNACNGMFMYCTNKQVLYGYYGWLFSNHKVFK